MEERNNNFTIIRYLATFMVIIGHMYILTGNEAPQIFSSPIHEIGLHIFFLISAYLLTISWLRDNNVFKYILKRIFRILPAFIVCILICSFVLGPSISELTLSEYYSNSSFYMYLKNMLFYIVFILPGVFVNNPYPNAVNGSIWCLPIEIIMYIFLPICICILKWIKGKRKSFVNFSDNNSYLLSSMTWITIFTLIIEIIHQYYFPTWQLVIYGTDISLVITLLPFYIMGSLYVFINKSILNLSYAFILIITCLSFQPNFILVFCFSYIIFPYALFSLIFDKKIFLGKNIEKLTIVDVSYGMFLYAFPIQQTVIFLIQKYNLTFHMFGLIFICFVLIIFVAILSKYFIENPAMKFCDFLIKQISIKIFNKGVNK